MFASNSMTFIPMFCRFNNPFCSFDRFYTFNNSMTPELFVGTGQFFCLIYAFASSLLILSARVICVICHLELELFRAAAIHRPHHRAALPFRLLHLGYGSSFPFNCRIPL